MPAIGIDLGTTNSCMGVFRNGKVEIIPNEFGQRTTASCVAFTETGRLVGDAARDQAFNNPTNTISESKRIIGRKFDEHSVRADMLHLAYKVESDRFGRACMRVTYKGESRLTYPEEVAAHVLGKLRSLAERYLGETVRDAVITVPAYFNDAQRQATRDAGQLAGFNVLRILNEPTAASLAYGLADCEGGQTASCELQCIAGVDSEEQTVLIFDFGGGTLDVSVLSIDSGIFEVRSTAGNTHLGGADFDNRLMNHVLRQYARQVLQPPVCTVESVREEVEKVSLHGGAAALDACVRAAKSDAVWMRRVRTECERAKCALSTQPQASVELELHSPADSRPDRVRVTVTREEFEKECADLFRATAEPVRRALDDARLEPARIDRVVLVGGASRMPNVRQMFITQFGFDAARIHDTVDPDVAIAYGAAIQAALLSGVRDSAVDDVLLIDVTPLSLGVETVGGVMNVLIQRNTTIPVSVKKIFTTHFDNQPAVEISVFQGERRLTAHNELLGMFELCGIREAPGGVPQIQVTFEVDANGILIVHATELGNTLPQCNVDQRVISVCRRDRSGWFESMARDAEQYRDQDEASVASIQAHATLEAYVRSLKRTLTETLAKRAANYNQPQSDASASASAALNGVDLEAIEEQCDSLVNWLEQTRADRSIAAEEFQKRGMQLDSLCAPLLAAVGKAPLSEAASRAPQQTGWSSHDNVD